MTTDQQQFLRDAAAAAGKAGHIFPEMAACEAALESGYGRSLLAVQDKNLFGMKQHKHPIYGTHVLPTREFVGQVQDTEDGKCDGWITINSSWISYPDWACCFRDRMATLLRLSPFAGFEHYKAALAAVDPRTYAREVSQKWSTDPEWVCLKCEDKFPTQDLAHEHFLTGEGGGHICQAVPGLGRGEKVIAIFDAASFLLP